MPVVRELFVLLDKVDLPMEEVAKRIGVSQFTLRSWRSGEYLPTAILLDTALNFVGYRLGIVEIEEDSECGKES